jgi:acyl-CoA synthetase (NDP forming)
MDFFFNPGGIAVVGATPNPLKGGYAILKNIIIGYKGNIYPVNPRYQNIEGLQCYPSVSAIPGTVDLAIVFIPAHQVPATVEECAARGIRGVMIESGGFAETGQEGRSLQQSLKDTANRTGIRLWGPNCMGLVDAAHGYVFSFMNPASLQRGLLPGTVSLVVQSGMLSAGFLVDIMSHGVMGISKVCSIGNKIDVSENDLMAYLLQDPATAVVGLYLETFSDGRGFMELCRQSTKPVVVLTGGKSKKGAEAALSHTASLAGNHRIISGLLAQAGVIEARDFKQMTDICRSLAVVPSGTVNKQGRIAVLTFSGGSGILTSDFAEEFGLFIAELSSTTREALAHLFPDWMPVSNPVDLWPALEKHGGTDVNVYSLALSAVLADPNVDAVVLHAFAGNPRLKIDIDDVAKQRHASGKPVFIWLLGRREEAFLFRIEALSYGIPVFEELYRAVECLSAVFHQRQADEIVIPSPVKGGASPLPRELNEILNTTSGTLNEYQSKRILRAHQIPTVEEEIIADASHCEKTARQIGFPLVMKGLQPGGVHKTELGLVHLNITTPEAALRTFDTLKKKMGTSGEVLIYKQVEGKIEIIAGLVRDPQFGPCVMLGIGGIMTEVFGDAVFAMAPLTHRGALELISRLRGQKLLNGFRGEPAVDREELARILVNLGNLGILYPGIQEIDVNPLIISKCGAVAVDATIILKCVGSDAQP